MSAQAHTKKIFFIWDLGAREVFRWIRVEKTSKTEVSDPNLDGSGMKFYDFGHFGHCGPKLSVLHMQSLKNGRSENAYTL